MELLKFIESEGSVTMDKLRREYGEDFEAIREELLEAVAEKKVSKHMGSGGVVGYRYPYYVERENRTVEDQPTVEEDEKLIDILEFIRKHPGSLTKEIRDGVHLGRTAFEPRMKKLLESGQVEREKQGLEIRWKLAGESKFLGIDISGIPKQWYQFSDGELGATERGLVLEGLATMELVPLGLGTVALWWPGDGADSGLLPALEGMEDFLKLMSVGEWTSVSTMLKKFSPEEITENLGYLNEHGMIVEATEDDERDGAFPGKDFKLVIPFEKADHGLINLSKTSWKPQSLAVEGSMPRHQFEFDRACKTELGVKIMRTKFHPDEEKDLLFKGFLLAKEA